MSSKSWMESRAARHSVLQRVRRAAVQKSRLTALMLHRISRSSIWKRQHARASAFKENGGGFFLTGFLRAAAGLAGGRAAAGRFGTAVFFLDGAGGGFFSRGRDAAGAPVAAADGLPALISIVERTNERLAYSRLATTTAAWSSEGACDDATP